MKKKLKVPRSLHRLFPSVTEAVDSLKSIKVTVKPRDCSEGKRMQAKECALAKATKRQYNADGVIIGLTKSYVIKGKKAIRYKTPVSVAREIISFDRHSDFAPGEYHLANIEPSQRLGRGSSGKRVERDSGRDRRKIHKHTVRVREI